ncbi:MAG: hypothetical protein RLZZ502_1618 [Pseudomonadota bacterium]
MQSPGIIKALSFWLDLKLERRYTFYVVILTVGLLFLATFGQTFLLVREQIAKTQSIGTGATHLVELQIVGQLNRVNDLLVAVDSTLAKSQSQALSKINFEDEVREDLHHYPMTEAVWIAEGGALRPAIGRTFIRVEPKDLQAIKTLMIPETGKDSDLLHSQVLFDTRKYNPYVFQAIRSRGNSAQYLIAKVNLDKVNESLADNIKRLSLLATYFVLTNQAQGSQLLSTSDRLKAFAEDQFRSDVFIQSAWASSNEEDAGIHHTRDGWQWISWRKMTPLGGMVLVQQPLATVLWPIAQSLLLSVVVLVIGVALAWYLGRSMARQMAKPVEDLAIISHKLAQGDFSARVTEMRQDELGTLASGFNKMADELQDLYQGLEDKVAEKTVQLEGQYRERARQATEIATLEERQRIMRDIHDSLGGSLVGLSGAVKSRDIDIKTLEAMVQEAIVDFRIAIDSLSPEPVDLRTVLASLRYRLEPRMKIAGISSVWDFTLLHSNALLSREMVFHLQRIIAEAFTNVVKHAKATQVTLTVIEFASSTEIRVQDNGRGVSEDGGKPLAADARQSAPFTALSLGRGIGNIQKRAAAIGGEVAISNAATGGTILTLTMPNAI